VKKWNAEGNDSIRQARGNGGGAQGESGERLEKKTSQIVCFFGWVGDWWLVTIGSRCGWGGRCLMWCVVWQKKSGLGGLYGD